MDVVISGRTVLGQQVGEWVQEVVPDPELHYVTTTRDLKKVADGVLEAPVFVVIGDAAEDRRLLAALSGLPRDAADRLVVLSAPSAHGDVVGLLPKWLRGRVKPLTRKSVHEELATRGDELGLDFQSDIDDIEMHFGCLVGESPAMAEVYRRIRKVAATDACCLVTGETGTGKEQVARAIHQSSNRRDQAFVPLNAGGIPRELVESQLFGHEKGAFTGAIGRRKGVFETADRGTLLIDEIGELPTEVQPVFLRALQDGEICPVGSAQVRHVDVRFVAATNRDLWSLVEQGKFREDLYYRLHVVPIELPSLYKRKTDIPALMRYWAASINERYSLSIVGMTQACLDALCAYRWPGNVRQLLHTLEQMMVLAEEPVLDTCDLPPMVAQPEGQSEGVSFEVPEEGIDFYAETERYQRAILEQVLDRVAWNKNRAASLLRMNRTTLVERLKRLGMVQEMSVGAA
jgi:transcriptional regulator with GAF, ATPase, and Fis domain